MLTTTQLREAARLYVESPEAQHGDEEFAYYEADTWNRIFEEVRRSEARN